MRFFIKLFLAIVCAVPLTIFSQTIPEDSYGDSFVVIELFTSEGCSSCPPADRLLAKLAKQESTRRFFLLSYHVDYWDYLGWKDRFSSPSFSDRQRWYAVKFASRRIYTPQMIINGTQAFVGSREDIAGVEIEKALKQKAAAKLSLKIVDHREKKVSLVALTNEEIPSSTVLLMSIIQKFAETAVLRGENRGEKLQHVNVVRTLQKATAVANQQIPITLRRPLDVQAEQLQIMAFLQDENSGEILAASVIDWPR